VTAEANPSGATAHVAVTGTQAAPPTAAAKALAFRWPVRGRVIGTFGTKPNGERNDGIDLAVPQGTEVRAAEDGVVAYSGNELKGYGKLVLIRHEDGYVTAYANASEILVKRNDKVRRGQVIAKSGQTGGVPVPQLHFEIRKGSTPVDPSQFLPTGT
jgi:murein DD-endopeptidase MepM/ murein hydrolase activator NlpD